MNTPPSRGGDGRGLTPASPLPDNSSTLNGCPPTGPLGVCPRCGTPRYQVEVDSRDGGAHTVLRCGGCSDQTPGAPSGGSADDVTITLHGEDADAGTGPVDPGTNGEATS